jgi:hypothetical protein
VSAEAGLFLKIEGLRAALSIRIKASKTRWVVRPWDERLQVTGHYRWHLQRHLCEAHLSGASA